MFCTMLLYMYKEKPKVNINYSRPFAHYYVGYFDGGHFDEGENKSTMEQMEPGRS